ncbi:hypothetical protein [Pseudaestuariivita sp.]|uniref:hypothetical protein n=1 Tax=Pseudaestuariivita sp. TaxID=2211669 RepID=UPI0040592818
MPTCFSLPASLTLAFAATLTTAAEAQTVSDCDWAASATTLIEPWEENSRTFANGKTRLALVDVLAPGTGPLRLLVLSPPYDELGGRQCRQITVSDSHGFADVFWGGLSAAYDPSVGLLFDLPVAVFDAARGDISNAMLSFTLNQSTGAIDAVFNPAD